MSQPPRAGVIQRGKGGSSFIPVHAGRHAVVPGETVGEVVQVGKTTVAGDRADRHVGSDEESFRPSEAESFGAGGGGDRRRWIRVVTAPGGSHQRAGTRR